ncbi:hypothetical protein BU14_0465s0004 [Porphyra umbilicalis]|uniref:F-box domain-containing protein n=1 Tax=Porphyra umbilicalis TaxID=2786 RepID=A0A1X6NUQ9_PORUM|nr:hypothetical protein BU14_0465s0004 [Porphyra umbilicalis]|eukprot:OSX72113.1 hypothetical protein BU14_0465s0004 [Porphyra umbilicalis]
MATPPPPPPPPPLSLRALLTTAGCLPVGGAGAAAAAAAAGAAAPTASATLTDLPPEVLVLVFSAVFAAAADAAATAAADPRWDGVRLPAATDEGADDAGGGVAAAAAAAAAPSPPLVTAPVWAAAAGAGGACRALRSAFLESVVALDVGPLPGGSGAGGGGPLGSDGGTGGRRGGGGRLTRVFCEATALATVARWAAFTVTLGRLTSVRRLTLRLVDMGDAAAEAAVSALLLGVLGHGAPALTALTVHAEGAVLPDAGGLVRGQPALRHLCLPHVPVWAAPPSHVDRAVSVYGGMRERLRSLDLSGLAVTLDAGDALAAFLNRLPPLPAVRFLGFGEHPSVDRAALAAASRACPAVTSLAVGSVAADVDSAAGAEVVAARFPRLRALNLTSGYPVVAQSVSAQFVGRLVCRLALHTLILPDVVAGLGALAAALPAAAAAAGSPPTPLPPPQPASASTGCCAPTRWPTRSAGAPSRRSTPST